MVKHTHLCFLFFRLVSHQQQEQEQHPQTESNIQNYTEFTEHSKTPISLDSFFKLAIEWIS